MKAARTTIVPPAVYTEGGYFPLYISAYNAKAITGLGFWWVRFWARQLDIKCMRCGKRCLLPTMTVIEAFERAEGRDAEHLAEHATKMRTRLGLEARS